MRMFAIVAGLASLTLCGGGAETNLTQLSSHTTAPMSTVAESQIREVNLHPANASPGDVQALQATIHNPWGELVILTLSITYANGQQQTVVESSLSGVAALSWTIPVTAARGTTHYRLTAGGCGCGMGDPGVQPLGLESSAQGTFMVD